MRLIILLATIFTCINVLASGNYKSRPSSSSTNSKPYVPIDYKPTPKTEKHLKQHIYSLPREGISLHEVSLNGDNFKVKGNYETEYALSSFSDHLKKPKRANKELKIKKKSSSFAGIKTNSFVIEGPNLW